MGLLALLALSPPLPLSGCTEVAAVGEPPGGPVLYGLNGTDLGYTPDRGVNECSTHVAVPGLPLSVLVLGGVLVAVSLSGRD
ncbi:hypothetical protein [Halalkalicoccus jeotgali]|uniref:Uncharacterized protein n=1 Tax=Halalkalicoccus jeotgali (strain DSM 18796 / CECT 7217 / JCM 14584 / KCTC 4019 / B3) TaxID=795797 RepID=D8J818_HALJB|nr:hypothetical protein [Halalkalicoccus jeotgali]ADJ14131.1 hypothetical protein HacjB3_03700 [Halalkalicoccus jeotgali B3]ELY34687.1 hypothetical protein C497_15593 [Halalkalicoccus jeotgali B3]